MTKNRTSPHPAHSQPTARQETWGHSLLQTPIQNPQNNHFPSPSRNQREFTPSSPITRPQKCAHSHPASPKNRNTSPEPRPPRINKQPEPKYEIPARPPRPPEATENRQNFTDPNQSKWREPSRANKLSRQNSKSTKIYISRKQKEQAPK